MEYRDYYKTLGVPRTASQAEIKKAFRKLAREHHPDRNAGDKAAEQRFKDINEANAVLADAEKRHLAALERAFDRAATRLSEYAEKQFDAQIRASREKAAERLSRELEKGIEQFARQAEQDVASRISDLARQTADRLQRRITDAARTGEAQHDVAADRVRQLSERLEEAIAAAEDRLAVIETDFARAGRPGSD